MKNSLLLQTLSAFNPEERRGIALFLQNAYFNRGKHARQIIRLFNLLNDRLEGGELNNWDKNHLQALLFEGKPVTSGYFNNLMSELLALFRKFILLQYSTDEALLDLAAARFYKDRGLENLGRQTLDRLEQQLASRPQMALSVLLLRFQSSLERLALESRHNHRQGDLGLPAALENLCQAFSAQLLHLGALLYEQQRYTPDMGLELAPALAAFRSVFREQHYFGQPALEIFEIAFAMIARHSDNPPADLTRYLDMLQQYESVFPFEMQRNLAAFGRNFCSHHLRTLPDIMRPQLLSLYKDHLAKGWMDDRGFLQTTYLLNMTTIGLQSGEEEWVRWVLNAYRNKITDDEGGTIWQYCMAKYHYHLGDLPTANRFVMIDKPRDIEIEKSIRILGIMIAFDLDPESPHLESQVQAFKMYLHRNKDRLTNQKHEGAQCFVATVRKLIAAASDPASSRKRKALTDVIGRITHSDIPVAEPHWLLKKIDTLTGHDDKGNLAG
ncbi:MAG: hypothetical protein U0U46_03880 [Saprospiraceae bacterium]